MKSLTTASLVALGALSASSVSGSAFESTVMIPTTDGTAQLHTVIDSYWFKDVNEIGQGTIIVEGSPYGADKIELIAFVYAQLLGGADLPNGRKITGSARWDLRGCSQSTGSWNMWHESAEDSLAVLDYVSTMNFSDGTFMMTGASADAIHAFATNANPHPGTQAQIGVFVTGSPWATFYPNGAFRNSLITGWLTDTVPTQAPDLIQLVKDNEPPTSDYWAALDASSFLGNVQWPTVQWAGSYDIFQSANLALFDMYQKSTPTAGRHRLVVDGYGHCSSKYNEKNTLFGRAALPLLLGLEILADPFTFGLPNSTLAEGAKNVTMYVMGSPEPDQPGQFWTTLEDFPEFVPTPYYFTRSGSLQTTVPSSSQAGNNTYVYDPTNPVPTHGGNNLLIPCGPLDQTPNEGRPDVLIFESEVLTEPVVISGPIFANLFVSTDAADTDFTVKLIDSFPANSTDPTYSGYNAIIQDGLLRMKWRNYVTNNDPNPSLLPQDPSIVYNVSLSLWNHTYVFAPGHRIKVHVSSSNYPRFNPNPNTGAFMNTTNANSLNVTATNTVYFSSTQPSSIILPIVQMDQLPPFDVLEWSKKTLSKYEANWEQNKEDARNRGVLRADLDKDIYSWFFEKAQEILDHVIERATKPFPLNIPAF